MHRLSMKSSATLARSCGSLRSALRISVQRWPVRNSARSWQRLISRCLKLFSERRTLLTPRLVLLMWRTLWTPLYILWTVWHGRRCCGHIVRVTQSTGIFCPSKRRRSTRMNRWRAKSKFSSFWWTSFWRPTLPGKSWCQKAWLPTTTTAGYVIAWVTCSAARRVQPFTIWSAWSHLCRRFPRTNGSARCAWHTRYPGWPTASPKCRGPGRSFDSCPSDSIDTTENTGFWTAASLCKFTRFHFSIRSSTPKFIDPFLMFGTAAWLIFIRPCWYLLAISPAVTVPKHDPGQTGCKWMVTVSKWLSSISVTYM